MRRFRVGIIVGACCIASMLAGCSHSNEAVRIASPQEREQSVASNVQRIENNPSISPQAKANVIAHLQGNAPKMPPP